MLSKEEKFLLDEIKSMCSKYGLKYLRHNNGSVMTSVEVKLKDDFIFWVEFVGQIRFSSEPWKVNVEDLVKVTTFSHKVHKLLKSNWDVSK